MIFGCIICIVTELQLLVFVLHHAGIGIYLALKQGRMFVNILTRFAVHCGYFEDSCMFCVGSMNDIIVCRSQVV